jgi:hypothetical protein
MDVLGKCSVEGVFCAFGNLTVLELKFHTSTLKAGIHALSGVAFKPFSEHRWERAWDPVSGKLLQEGPCGGRSKLLPCT